MSSVSFADDDVERNKGRKGVEMDVLRPSCRFSPSLSGSFGTGSSVNQCCVVAVVSYCFVLVQILRGRSTLFSSQICAKKLGCFR